MLALLRVAADEARLLTQEIARQREVATAVHRLGTALHRTGKLLPRR